ncbi:MAG: type II toxin-antitoxin system PemK/MazF family toxin [Chloroflexota bacterium]
MKPGDVVLVRFPQTDLQVGKLRPALALAIAPGRHADVLLVMITSRSYQAIPNFDEVIETSDKDFPETGLKSRSVLRLSRLVSVETSIVNARLGEISAERLRVVKQRVIDWLRK